MILLFGLLPGLSACGEEQILPFVEVDSTDKVESPDEPTQKPEATLKESQEPTPEPTLEPILTIKKVVFSRSKGIISIKAVDESGKEINLPTKLDEWFFEADSDYNLVMQVGSGGLTITSSDEYPLKDDGSKLIITIVIEGSELNFELMIGSQFKYSYDSEGNIKFDIKEMQE